MINNALLGHLDEIDTKIVRLLSQNSRMSYVAIAKEVGLSRVAVKARIESMESQKIIEKYSIIINPTKIGNSLAVFFDMKVQPDRLNETINNLIKIPQIIKLYQMTGNTQLHIHAMLESPATLGAFLQDNIYVLPGIEQVECNMIIARLKDNEEIKI
jgi:DNA-binding Lrp family transcriptional regulator